MSSYERLNDITTNKMLKAQEALKEIKAFNRLRNDLDAYLYDLAEWGIGESISKPDRASFGIKT